MSLYLVHMPFNPKGLMKWGISRGLVRRGIFDEGFILHKIIAETVGRGMLQPFRVFIPKAGRGSIYAYSSSDPDRIKDSAHLFASPEVNPAISFHEMRGKEMPRLLSQYQRVGFDVRLRPTRMSRKDLQTGGISPRGKAQEVDAYLWERVQGTKVQGVLGRKEVYTQWLQEKTQEAAQIECCDLSSFQRSRVFRGRHKKAIEGPDAILRGTLKILDPERFHQILSQGIGRHKAYGYGMILIRPPRPC